MKTILAVLLSLLFINGITTQESANQNTANANNYNSASPTCPTSVSADAVRVLYARLDNPLTITSADDNVAVTISNGTIRKVAPGRYIANVYETGSANVDVTAFGSTSSFQFRVKKVPDPVAVIGSYPGGRMAASLLQSEQGVGVELKDFVFEGIKFEIASYVVYATGEGFPGRPETSANTGSSFNEKSLSIIKKCRPGTTLVIDEIRATGPAGDTRPLPPIAFNLF